MNMAYYFNRFGVVLAVLVLMACAGGGGGGGGGGSDDDTAPNISVSATSVAFGGVVRGNSVDRTITITNTGDADLAIGDIAVSSAPFSISGDTCSSTTLDPGASCTVGVRFSPQAQGSYSAQATVESNAPGTGTVDISLSGTGYGLDTWINSVDCTLCPDITLKVTVTDPANPGSVLNTLTTANFQVYQDDEQILLNTATLEDPSYVSLVLALDWSSSTENVRSDIQAAAKTFIDSLRYTNALDNDEAAICKFNANRVFYPNAAPLFVAGNDAGKTNLKAFIDADYAGTGTTLYDTVVACVDRASQGAQDKRVIIVLCDGVDTASTNTLAQAVAYAKLHAIPVFAIFYYDAEYEGGDYGNPETMQQLASETGGLYYTSDTANLEDIFAWITTTLKSTYLITYSSDTCTGTVNIRVRAEDNTHTLYGIDSRTVDLD